MTLVQLKYAITVAGANSLNKAAKMLFISQPSLSTAIRSLEKEIGFNLFMRSKKGITLTPKGEEFIGYAKSVIEQYELLDAKFISEKNVKKTFSVSIQHYTLAVNAFIQIVKKFGLDEYEFEINETKTHEIIENVKKRKSELGVLYLNGYNQSVLKRIFAEADLKFTPLFECGIYVSMWQGHPLADRKELALEDLDDYPCLRFSQGEHNSFHFSEEVLSSHRYKQFIRVNDRATLLNLMIGLNGYTLCSGIICEELTGKGQYVAVKLKPDEKVTIGYLSRKDEKISEIGQYYLAEIEKYKEKAMS